MMQKIVSLACPFVFLISFNLHSVSGTLWLETISGLCDEVCVEVEGWEAGGHVRHTFESKVV